MKRRMSPWFAAALLAAAALLPAPGLGAARAGEGYGYELVAPDPPPDDREPPPGEPGARTLKAVPNPLPKSAPAAAAVPAVAVPAPSGDAPPLTASFRGIAMAETDGWIPPDPNLAVGPGHVLAVVNETIALFDKAGARQGIKTLQAFFGTDPELSVFDPKVAYDPWAKRYLVIALSGRTGTESFYRIAASRGKYPTLARSSWRFFRLNAGKNGANQTANWADYPGIGFDARSDGAVYVTSNQFSAAGAFQYAKIRVLKKTQLYEGTSKVTWKDFWGMKNANGSLVFGIQPAQNLSDSPRGHLVNTARTGGGKVTYWRVKGDPGSPTLSRHATLAVIPYAEAAPAAQPTGPDIDTPDCRVMNAFFQDGTLYTTFTHAFDADGDANDQDESAVRLLGIDGGAKAVLFDYPLALPGRFLYWPGIGVDAAGSVYAVFACSGPDLRASACYTAWGAGEAVPRVPALLKEGEQAYSLSFDGRVRWGDYAGVARDPVTGEVWVSHEYAKDVGEVTAEWETWIGRIGFPAPSR